MAIQGSWEPGWYAELRDLHLPGMRSEYKRCLIALLRGESREDIAQQEGIGPSTLKRWIETATAEIGASLTDKHASGAELRGGWATLHLPCCLLDQLEESA